MREGAKKRLAGAVVVVALAVIFVPMLFEENPPASVATTESLPAEPVVEDRQIAQPNDPALESPASTFAAESEPPPLPAPSGTENQASDAGAAQDGAYDDFSRVGQPGQIGFSDVADEPPSTTIMPRSLTSEDRKMREERARETARTEERRAAAAKQPAPQPKRETKQREPEPKQKPAAEGKSKWVIQVASLTNPDSASAMQKKLKGAGYAAFVERAEVGGRTFYRVRVGSNGDRAGAERTAALLRQQQKLDTLIQRQAER